MVDRRKMFRRSSPSQISDTPRAGFEPAQNLSSSFVEGNYAVVITTSPRLHINIGATERYFIYQQSDTNFSFFQKYREEMIRIIILDILLFP